MHRTALLNCTSTKHGRTAFSRPKCATTWTKGPLYAGEGMRIDDAPYALGIVMAKGPNRGKAAIYLDGTKVATVDTLADQAVNRSVVWRQTVTAGGHTVRVVNLATPGHPRVDLDAFVLMRK